MKLLLVSFILFTQLFSHSSYSDSVLTESEESLISQNQDGDTDNINIYGDVGSLKGSRNSQLRQNLEADLNGFSRIKDNAELTKLIKKGVLIKLRKIPNLRIDKRLNKRYHYVLPWTGDFLHDFGITFKENFKSKFPVCSAVRTKEHQAFITKKGNRNAAPITGETSSSHLTGATIDIPKKQLSRKQIKFLRQELSRLEVLGLLEVTEEHNQAVFHVMVYKSYQQNNEAIALQ